MLINNTIVEYLFEELRVASCRFPLFALLLFLYYQNMTVRFDYSIHNLYCHSTKISLKLYFIRIPQIKSPLI